MVEDLVVVGGSQGSVQPAIDLYLRVTSKDMISDSKIMRREFFSIFESEDAYRKENYLLYDRKVSEDYRIKYREEIELVGDEEEYQSDVNYFSEGEIKEDYSGNKEEYQNDINYFSEDIDTGDDDVEEEPDDSEVFKWYSRSGEDQNLSRNDLETNISDSSGEGENQNLSSTQLVEDMEEIEDDDFPDWGTDEDEEDEEYIETEDEVDDSEDIDEDWNLEDEELDEDEEDMWGSDSEEDEWGISQGGYEDYEELESSGNDSEDIEEESDSMEDILGDIGDIFFDGTEEDAVKDVDVNIKQVETESTNNVSEPVEEDVVIPNDLRAFVKMYPNCEMSFALKYFSRKEIEKQLTIGRVFKRKNRLLI